MINMDSPAIRPAKRPVSYRSIIMTATAGLIFAFLEYCYPVSIDTLFFEGFFNHCLASEGCLTGAWSKYAETIGSHDNIRFAQMSWPLFAYVPKWLYALLTGALVSVIIWFAARLAARAANLAFPSFRVCLFSFIVFVLSMPWAGDLLCPVYVLNYIPTTIFSLWLIDLLTDPRSRGTKAAWGAILLSALISCFHEEYSVMTGGAVFVLIILRKGRVPFKYYFAFLTLLAVTVLMVFCSNVPSRVFDDSAILIISAPVKWLVQNWTSVIFLLLVSFMPAFRKRRRNLYETLRNRPIATLLFIIILEGLAVSSLQPFNWRISAYSNYSSGLLILIVCAPIFGKLSDKAKSLVSILAVFISAAFFILLFIEAWHVKKENDRIMAELKISTTGTVEGDITAHADNRLRYLGLTGGRVWKYPYTWPALQLYLGNGNWPAVVAKDLLDADPAEDITLKGDGIRRHGSSFYITPDGFDSISHGRYSAGYGVADTHIDYADKDGRLYPSVFTLFLKYRADDGKCLYAVIPFALKAAPEDIVATRSDGLFNSCHKEYYDHEGNIKDVHINGLN